MTAKYIAFALSALLCINIVSCSNNADLRLEPTEEEKRIVMTVGSREVQYQEYRCYYLNNKRDSYGADTEITDEIAAELKALTENNVKQRHGYLMLAEKYGASLTEAQKAEADKMVEDYRDNFSDDESYLLWLSEQYFTNDLYKSLLAESNLPYNILDAMKTQGVIKTDEASIDAVMESDDVICIKEIFVNYNGIETKPIAEDRAEEALAKLINGESFEDTMTSYSSYSSSAMPKDHGVYISRYTRFDEIWNAAISLAEGEYSCVIESAFGFHIIMRCAKDDEYMAEHRDDIFETYCLSKLNEEFYALSDTLEIAYTDYGSSLDFKKIS